MDDQTAFKSVQGDQRTVYTPTGEERTMAILSHILNLVAPLIAPLVIYLIKKDESAYVAEHAKESLNFQITMAICFMISTILTIVIIGAFLLVILGFLSLVLVIIATVKANDNKMYRYPINFRFIK